MKQVIVGLLCVLLGAAGAIGINFAKNHSRPKPIITIAKKGANFLPSQFSLENAPTDSIRGTIATMSGEIYYQARTATGAAKLNQAIPVQQGETWIASDSGNLTINFAPAATVALFPQTKLEVIQTLPLNLVFNQTEGVGQYNAVGVNPVTIRGFNLIINLDSGLLVVDTNPETGTVILDLKTGSARVAYNSPEFDSKIWQLEPGDVFEYDSSLRQGYFK